MKRYENGEISIPHKQMLELKNSGKLNLGMFNDVSVKIADNPDLAPKAKSSGLAMHFWSWIAVGQFLYSIYWSFTGLWWVFIPSFFLMGAIHKANKKGTSQNLLFEAERDKEFYEKIRKINSWNYEVDESVAKKYQKKEISRKKFIFLSAKMTGLKAAKIVMLLSLLALPVVGQIVGVYLISKLMLAAIGILEVKKEKLLLPAPTK